MLYLTYDNVAHTDGAGAQLQRIVSIYLISKFYNIGYVHQPITRMEYQGLKAIEENKFDPQQIDDYNKLFLLPSTSDN